MFYQHLAHALPDVGRVAGQHLVKDHPQRIDVDRFAVFAFTNFRSHIVHAADSGGVATAMTGADGFTETIVADFNGAVFEEKCCVV